MLLLALGLGLAIVADRQFKRAGAIVKPFRPSTALVTDGACRISRHPMYLGMVLVLLGLGIGLGSAVPFVVLPPFVWAIDARFVGHEERATTDRFGDPYDRSFRDRHCAIG